jgi:hypothetical protein
MRHRAIALTAALLLTPVAAQAEPIGDAFKSLCLATGAGSAAVKSAAAAQGFVTPPESIASQLHVPNVDHATTLLKLIDGGMVFVVWGDGAFPSGASSMKADLCAVGGLPALPDANQTLQAMLGVGPPIDSGTSKLFLFNDNKGARTAVKPDDSAAALVGIGTHQLRMAAAQNEQSVSVMLLIAPVAQ